ncbi:methyl-accepting chemotaxis protein [Methylovorus sp. SPW-M1]
MLSKLQNFRVGTRLSIGFVVIMTLMIGSSVFAVLQVNDVSRTWESFESITLQKRDAIDTASKGLADGVHYFKNYVLRGGEYADKFAQSMANIEKGMESYKRLGAMSDEESLLLEKISKGVADYKAAQAQVMQLKLAGTDIVTLDKSVKGADKPVNAALAELLELNHRNTSIASAHMKATVSAAIKWVIILSVIILIMGFLIAWILTHSITKPLNKALQMAKNISHGQLEETSIPVHRDETGQLLIEMQSMARTINTFISDVQQMSFAHKAGDIDVHVAAEKFQGAYQAMVAGVNNMVADHIDLNRRALKVVLEFGEGNFNAPLELFPGKQAFINDTIEQVRNNLKHLIVDVDTLAKAAQEGNLSVRVDAAKHQGDFKRIVDGFNNTLDAVIGPLNLAAQYIDDLSKGSIPKKIDQSFHGDFERLKLNINQCIDAINGLVEDASLLAASAAEGNLAIRADAQKHFGEYRKIVDGVNSTLDGVVGPLNIAASYISQISKGSIPKSINEEFKGDFNIIKSNLNTCILAINRLIQDTKVLVDAAEDGRIYVRADSSQHEGDFKKIVEGINQTLQLIADPIVVVKMAAETINQGASEISNGNNDLSQRTEEQASSLEETASSMEELASTVKQNADNARHANELANEASSIAVKGGEAMSEVINTMSDINASAHQIEEIISVINGISFQTNILALNAAVEAARAGENGRGFAVVAEEVRNLAQRSSTAAKEIKELITASVSKTIDGTRQVEAAGKTIDETVTAFKRVAQIIAEIAAASAEQSSGINQVNNAITLMDQVTQQNAALVEEAAAAAESLMEQADNLVGAVLKFKTDPAQSSNVRQLSFTAG